MLAALALCIKAVVTICSDAWGTPKVMKLAIPGKSHGEHPDSATKSENCAFSGLAHSALGGADDILLAIAFAIIVMLGLRPAIIPLFRKLGHLRPPLRGPPSLA